MGSQEIKRQSFTVDKPPVGLGCVIETVEVFLFELPKGQPIKGFNYGTRLRKNWRKGIFLSCCVGKTAAFYDRDLPCLLFTLYSEGYVIERVGAFLPKIPKG